MTLKMSFGHKTGVDKKIQIITQNLKVFDHMVPKGI